MINRHPVLPEKNLTEVTSANLTDPVAAAQYLLGAYLVRDFEGSMLTGRIVETEAYYEQDEASHSYRGRTPRTDVMFGPPGMAYVYFSYGVHWCMNVTAGAPGQGAAVLIRAIEPISGLNIMRTLRGAKAKNGIDVANGPGKLTQAFAIDKTLYGHDLRCSPLRLLKGRALLPEQIVTTTRIGISKAVDAPLRFYIKDSKFISRK